MPYGKKNYSRCRKKRHQTAMLKYAAVALDENRLNRYTIGEMCAF